MSGSIAARPRVRVGLRNIEDGSRLALGVLLAALGVYSLLFFYHALRLTLAHGELNYAESTWLFAALRVRERRSVSVADVIEYR